MSGQEFSVANEVVAEVKRVFEKCPNAVEAIGGEKVLQDTVGIIKEVARAHRDGDSVNWEKVDSKNKFPQLRPLEHDCQLTQLGAPLSDADLYASGAAGEKASAVMSELFTIEDRKVGADVDYRTDQARMGFFDFVIGSEGFTSIAGREIANEVHMEMRAQTEANIEGAKPLVQM